MTNHLIHIDFIVILRHYRYPSDYLHVFSFFFTIFPFLVVILWCIYSSLISLLLLLLGSQNQLRKYTIAKSLICRASDPDWDLKISMPAYNPQCCDSHQENKLLLSFTVESTVLIVIIPLPSRNRNPTYNHLVDRVECWWLVYPLQIIKYSYICRVLATGRYIQFWEWRTQHIVKPTIESLYWVSVVLIA